MTPRISVATACAVLVCLAACGCGGSGTWEDDPGNWGRVFGSEKPADVVVLHSKFWRSPHLTTEFAYFFAIENNTALREQLFAENDLKQIDGDAADQAHRNHFGEPPAWFAPQPADRYEVWVYSDAPESNFRLFVDRKTGALFLTDYLV